MDRYGTISGPSREYTPDDPGFPENQGTKPTVKLVGEDGNVFAIIGRVRNALRSAGLHDQVDRYTAEVTAAASYDEALMVTLRYVDEESDEDGDDLAYRCIECGEAFETSRPYATHLVVEHGYSYDRAESEASIPYSDENAVAQEGGR